jgi:DNA-binding NarL/FixJ family response regulator
MLGGLQQPQTLVASHVNGFCVSGCCFCIATRVGAQKRDMAQLAGKSVLIVEDHSIIAMDLAQELKRQGVRVLGPVATTAAALDVIASTDLDGGILDLKLSDRPAFPVADALADRYIPFVFATGYDFVVPARHAKVRRLEKPIKASVVCRALEAALSQGMQEP